MSIVWVARDFTNPEEPYVRVASSKEAAIYVIYSRIKQAEWQQFYDSLMMGQDLGMQPVDERLRRDLTEMDIDTVLRAWNGYEHGFDASGGEDWGDMSVYPQEIWTRTDGSPDFIEPESTEPEVSHLAEVDGWLIGDHALYASQPNGGKEFEVEVVAVHAPAPRPLLVHPDEARHPGHRWSAWVAPQDLRALESVDG